MSFTPVFDEVLEESPADIWKASPVFPGPVSEPNPTNWRLVAVAEDPQPNPGFFKLAGMFIRELVCG